MEYHLTGFCRTIVIAMLLLSLPVSLPLHLTLRMLGRKGFLKVDEENEEYCEIRIGLESFEKAEGGRVRKLNLLLLVLGLLALMTI